MVKILVSLLFEKFSIALPDDIADLDQSPEMEVCLKSFTLHFVAY